MTMIQSIIQGISGLAPMPHVAMKLIALSKDSDSSMAEAVDLIAHDTGTTTNVLKAANSAYYGRSQPFDSIHQATVYMGLDEIVDLTVLSCSAENLNQSQSGYHHCAGELWRSSVATALLARKLADRMGISDIHLVFTGALLKDIDKIVLSQYVSEKLPQIAKLIENGKNSFREAEKKVIGIDHAELGAIVANTWRFSRKMVDIIAHHHDPPNAEVALKETAIVHVSDVVYMMMGVSGGRDALAYRFHRSSIEALGLSDIDFQTAIADSLEELSNAEELIA